MKTSSTTKLYFDIKLVFIQLCLKKKEFYCVAEISQEIDKVVPEEIKSFDKVVENILLEVLVGTTSDRDKFSPHLKTSSLSRS
jgi:hypothetical protein